ncbi:hypothetical protein AD939_02205 [Gluconobacter oxydans]|nr:hypothetical protein AD939_02205 [Gluconobacter oxydans]
MRSASIRESVPASCCLMRVQAPDGAPRHENRAAPLQRIREGSASVTKIRHVIDDTSFTLTQHIQTGFGLPYKIRRCPDRRICIGKAPPFQLR